MTEKNKKALPAVGRMAHPPFDFHLEADRSGKGMSVILGGIIGISDFCDDCILLRSHGGKIMVNGKNLFVSVYENNSIEIQGKVEGIKFIYGKN